MIKVDFSFVYVKAVKIGLIRRLVDLSGLFSRLDEFSPLSRLD